MKSFEEFAFRLALARTGLSPEEMRRIYKETGSDPNRCPKCFGRLVEDQVAWNPVLHEPICRANLLGCDGQRVKDL